ncbi:hypothetical protein DPMN_159559 [Dreissena polymorpha]|uniref:Uncharacterized protein n=1 Tax=Dreissena polymorpha TaxID=45954 RepID=A0A9D4EL56_DREPO|nr:hypothetical protein DPMN_159559 [Dreissena polymorpha]
MLDGSNRRGRQMKSSMNNLKEWTFFYMDEIIPAVEIIPDWLRNSVPLSAFPPNSNRKR